MDEIKEQMIRDVEYVILRVFKSKPPKYRPSFDDVYSAYNFLLRGEYGKAIEEINAEKKKLQGMARLAFDNCNKLLRFGMAVERRGSWYFVFGSPELQVVLHRIYVNPQSEHAYYVINALANLLAKLQREGKHSFNFKFAVFPDPLRADKIVIYFEDIAVGHELFKMLRGLSLKNIFSSHAPRFTIRITNGVGFAAEPNDVERSRAAKWREDTMIASTLQGGTSFGSYVSEGIARSLEQWCDKNKRVPTEADARHIAEWIYEKFMSREENIIQRTIKNYEQINSYW